MFDGIAYAETFHMSRERMKSYLSGKRSRRVKCFVTDATSYSVEAASHLKEFRRASERASEGEREGGGKRGWEYLARSRLKLKPYNTHFASPTSHLSKCDRICDSGIAFSRGASASKRKKAGGRVFACEHTREENGSRRRCANRQIIYVETV